MISEDSLKQISHIFCGDTEGFYSYKTGAELVSFFNNYFGYKDIYQSGFPSRWIYVYNKLVEKINAGSIGRFFDITLGREYLMRDLDITEIDALEQSQKILHEYNDILRKDFFKLIQKSGHYILIQESDDLVLIGSGGFANAYRRKSDGLVVKKLKDDYLTDASIRSRFKREYTITKALQGVFGIIEVYSFDEGNCSYTMERAETTLEDYVLKGNLTDESKLKCLRMILYIMSKVHERNIIHRDLSPNNIFVIAGRLKIADFGLGKDLNMFASHQTIHTNSMGQYFYCAPEQFMLLREADKRSDVYSLGRIINFVMTGSPTNSNHSFGNVAQKATNSDAAYRYGDAIQLSSFFEKSVQYNKQAEIKEQVLRKIDRSIYDSDVEMHIYNMKARDISEAILNGKPTFLNALIKFMHSSEDQAQHIIQAVEQSFRDVCRFSFEANDPFAFFAIRVLHENFSFSVKEIAATIIRYVAWDVNRFGVQRSVEDILNSDIDPMLKDVLRK